MTKKIKKCFKLNDNEHLTNEDVWNILKAVVRGKFTTLNAYKVKKSKINDLSFKSKYKEGNESRNQWNGKQAREKNQQRLRVVFHRDLKN